MKQKEIIKIDGIEKEVLAHRYLYYVLLKPIIADRVYDQLEEVAVELLTETSIVHDPGSSLPESYPKEVVNYALKLRADFDSKPF